MSGRASSLKNSHPQHLQIARMGSGTLRRGGFSRFTSSGGGGGTSSLPLFLDGSLDAMHLLEEGEALGFTSW
jgi:hypothetical protein